MSDAMTIGEIRDEWERTGRLSATAAQALADLLASDDPYEAITTVGDLNLTELSAAVAECMNSDDPMIRWNTMAVLATRLRSAEHGELVLEHSGSSEDELVRGAALAGLGALISLVPAGLQYRMSATLLAVLSDESELVEMRGAAYEGMLEALNVPLQDRPSAAKLVDMSSDIKEEVVGAFRRNWLGR